MDGRRFDQLSRSAVASRRSVVAGLAAALGTDLLTRFGFGGTALAACRDRKGRKCDGCCRGGECQSGITFAECGQGGEQCQNCRDKFKECERRGNGDGGTCICSKRSCERKGDRGGCCTELDKAKGTCKSGTEAQACGQGGKQCVDCTRQSKTCDPDTRKCCIALNDRGCSASDRCCTGLTCESGRCIAGGACRHAGEACNATQKCCESSEVLECRSGTCCALQFGFCQIAADCCDSSHECFGHSCQ